MLKNISYSLCVLFSLRIIRAVQSSWIGYYHHQILQKSDPLYVRDSLALNEYARDCHIQQSDHCLYLPHQQSFSDILRIGNIQYIGGNLTKAYYGKLYESIDYLTSLSPYRATPYIFSQHLMPASTQADISDQLKQITREQTADIGEKGLYYTCNAPKLQTILQYGPQSFQQAVQNKTLHQNPQLIAPCSHFQLPQALGFVYFFYLKDYTKAINAYTIASFDPDIPLRIPLFTSLLIDKHSLQTQ